MELMFLCLKVFFARILDVSMGTVRTILVVKDKKLFATIIGFFEVLIWFVIVREALSVENMSIWVAIFYAGGFATGTYLGITISSKVIDGTLSLQVITSKANDVLADAIRKEGFAVSSLDIKGHNKEEEKQMLLIEINKKKLVHLKKVIEKNDPKAFVVIDETKYVQNGFIK